MLAAFRQWRGHSTPIASVTTLAALAVAVSGGVDLVFGTTGGLPFAWTLVWMLVSLLVACLPWLFASRFPPIAGVLAAIVFTVVVSIQLAASTTAIVSANNLVLYPMLGCYLGWFYRRAVYRSVLAGALALTLVAVLVNPLSGIVTIWINVALATTFCMEAAGYLRAVLDRQIRTDPLTGATTRAGLVERITREVERSARTGEPLSVVIIDVDDFKAINDRQGHAAGDRYLIDLVAMIRSQTRPYDTVARLGGDEFLLLLPSTDRPAARSLAMRLQSLTAGDWSYGVAQARADDTVDALLARADDRLYAAKGMRTAEETHPIRVQGVPGAPTAQPTVQTVHPEPAAHDDGVDPSGGSMSNPARSSR